MTIAEALLEELEDEVAATRKVLERVPEDKLDWTPHAKSMNMGRLANHVAEVPEWAPTFLSATELDIQSMEGPPPQADTVAGILEKFDAGVTTAREQIGKSSDEDFGVLWTLKNGGETMFTASRFSVLRRWLMNHLVHHRAQLGVYLRMNEVAVPQTLGPTADESGM
jgi:uncharacterized damage-inducible protein DinB